MIQKKLIDYLQHQPEKMARRWLRKVRRSEHMTQYNTLDDEELVRRGMSLFQSLGKWLDGELTQVDIGQYFVTVGKKRFEEQFPLCEVNYALYLEKKVFWRFVREDDMLDSPAKLYSALGLITAISDFFDLGNFYLARGYMVAIYVSLKKSGKWTAGEIDSFFFPGSFLKSDSALDTKFQYFPFFDASEKPDFF